MTLSDLNLGFALPELTLTAALFGLLMFGAFRGNERLDLVVGGTIAALILTLLELDDKSEPDSKPKFTLPAGAAPLTPTATLSISD